MFDDTYEMQIECSCGAIFEPDDADLVTDEYGDRWAVCPDCKCQIRLLAKD